MAVPLVLIAALAGAQLPPPSPAARPQAEHSGLPFMSPMGEPFFGRTPGEDGLVVWFQQADANHDGVLTVDEMSNDAARFFQVLDLNHDGEIDPQEIAHYENVVAPELRVQPVMVVTDLPGGGTEASANDEIGAGRYGLLQIPEPVVSADSNFNRGVSLDEFRKAASDRFHLLDYSHAGRLTLADLQKIRRAASDTVRRHRGSDKQGPSENYSIPYNPDDPDSQL